MSELGFGIYRPLAPRDQRRTQNIMEQTAQRVRTYLHHRKRPRDFYPQNDFGITFLAREIQSHRMHDMQSANVAKEALLSSLVRVRKREVSPAKLELGDVHWFGRTLSSLGFSFKPNATTRGLFRETEELRQTFRSLGLNWGVELRTPNHIIVARYGSHNRPIPLPEEIRDGVAKMVAEGFAKAHVTTLYLGGLVVGTHYTTPLPDFPVG